MRARSRTLPAVVAACALALLAPGPGRAAAAQAPLTLTGRAGPIVPVSGFRTGPGAGEELSAGLSIGMSFALERTEGRHLFLGFSQHRFGCSGGACGGDGEYVATAWDLGARFDFGTGTTVPWLRVGLTVPRVEVDGAAATESDATDLGIGGELGGGLRITLRSPIYVSPGVRFGAADAEIAGGGKLRMRYVVVDLGVVVGF